jgi:uncharacterized membrane protein YkvA (DUF1232 family)
VIPEEIHGSYGYVDDIFFCAFVADHIQRDTGQSSLLTENWEGEAEVTALVREMLAKEADLIGDARDHILRYVGLDVLLMP